MGRSFTPVLFEPSGKAVRASSGSNLFHLMRKLGLSPHATCGGKGKCGKCKVQIEAGAEGLGPLTETEEKALLPYEIAEHYRLACKVAVPKVHQLTVRVPSNHARGMKLQIEGTQIETVPDPAVTKYLVRPSDSSLSLEANVLALLKAAHGLDCTIEYEALPMLPSAVARGKGLLTCVVYNGTRVIAVEPGDTTKECFGFAADIGTTKLALYLVDLASGRELASVAAPNPQAQYGDDVMSRIAFAMAAKGNTQELQKILLKEVASLVRRCAATAGVHPHSIYEASFVGNPCMMHTLLGISPDSLAFFPYRSVMSHSVSLRARDLPVSLGISTAARVYVLPLIAGFVGADTVAAQLAVGQLKDRRAQLLLDIGTNTEVVLSAENSSMACSCASGPAFEGMHILHGRKADSASIDRVWIDPKTLEISFRTISGARPAGICGSGIASAIAEMLKAGILNPAGRLRAGKAQCSPRIRKGESGNFEVVIAWKHETSIGGDIVITQKDILEVQKAKAAIHAGCTLLMKRKGVMPEQIDRLVIAGAFGQYVDKEAVRAIGMFPDVPLDRIEEAGNAAGAGAKMALISRALRREAENLARSTQYYELALDDDFVRVYASSMLFPGASARGTLTGGKEEARDAQRQSTSQET